MSEERVERRYVFFCRIEEVAVEEDLEGQGEQGVQAVVSGKNCFKWGCAVPCSVF